MPVRLVTLLLLVTACQQAPSDGAEPPPSRSMPVLPPATDGPRSAEVRDALVEYYADFSARDWDAFAAHFHEGATLSTVWSPAPESPPELMVMTIPDFVAQAPQGPGSQPIFEERMTDAEIRVTGDLATAWASYDARFGSPGEVMEWSGIDAFTLIRFEGEWRIVSLAYVAEG